MNKKQFNVHLFETHIESFMKTMKLLDPHKEIVVAVSGGVDSMALLHILSSICRKLKRKLTAVHINHGTRPANVDEEKLVIDLCQNLSITLDIVKFNLDIKQSNFEAIARSLRAQVYTQYIERGGHIYTAHHLDDSFEWSMIQSFKQSRLESTLGIPVFNRGLIRPFMCVSKSHIVKYAKAVGLVWAEDSSNRDERFERNFFRQKLTAKIKKRYPHYLQHYVARQNQLALDLRKHRLNVVDRNLLPKKTRFFEKRETSGAVILKSKDFTYFKDQIKEWIHFFSKSYRGEINLEVDKLIKAHLQLSSDPKALKMKGPMSFSGGVSVFILGETLLITNNLHLDYYRKYDELLLNYLKKNTQITEGSLLKNAKNVIYPYLCFLSQNDRSKSSKLIHPLIPSSTKWLKDQNIPYSFYPLLSRKVRQNLIHTAVILDSSVLGL